MSEIESFPGILQSYQAGPNYKLPIFLSGDTNGQNALILIGGLYEGMLNPPYYGKVAEMCSKIGWTVAQPHLTSSFHGFAVSSLEKDGKELAGAVRHLRALGKQKIALMGSSTGCQDIMTYMLDHQSFDPIDGGILQAPVSDREAFEDESYVKAGEVANKLYKEGKAGDLAPAQLAKDWSVPNLTVYRAWSLLCVGGDDDFFSSDLPDKPESGTYTKAADTPRPLSETFGKLPENASPLLFLFGGEDRCFPFKKTSPAAQADRWFAAARAGEHGKKLNLAFEVLPGAGHSVEEPDAQDNLVGIVKRFMQNL